MSDILDRLDHAHQHSQQRVLGSHIFGEARDEIGRLREALSSETAAREKAERERDAAYSVLTLAWKSIGRFPGSVYDRLMSRIERLLKGRNFDYSDPDLTAANATIADLTRKLEAAAVDLERASEHQHRAEADLFVEKARVEEAAVALARAADSFKTVQTLNSHGASDRTYIEWLRSVARAAELDAREAHAALLAEPRGCQPKETDHDN